MGVEVYPLKLKHAQHGRKVVLTRREADLDKRNGWVEDLPVMKKYPNRLTVMLNKRTGKRY